MYFSKFPLKVYDVKGDKNYKLLPDILRRVKLRSSLASSRFVFDKYNVKENENPEDVAFKYYGRADYHWTILIANDIVDYYEEWPMSVQRFEEFIKDKYPNSQDLHHYEINQTSGDTTKTINIGSDNTGYESASAISFYTYEQRLQDEKRQIRLIKPEYIQDFVTEFEDKLDEAL